MLKDKVIDFIPDTQDKAKDGPLTLAEKEVPCRKAKELNASHIAISCPYNVPSGAPDPMNQIYEWIMSAEKFGLKVWMRPSWADDEGWYGVPKQTANDRITDTVNWVRNFES